MRKIAILSGCLTLLWIASGGLAQAGSDHGTLLKERAPLRDQMAKLLVYMADLDILVNRDQEIDYSLFQDDAEGLLKTLDSVKGLDAEKLFSKEIAAVERPTKKLLEYAKQQNPKAAKYPDKIFNACFQCHATYRDPRMPQ